MGEVVAIPGLYTTRIFLFVYTFSSAFKQFNGDVYRNSNDDDDIFVEGPTLINNNNNAPPPPPSNGEYNPDNNGYSNGNNNNRQFNDDKGAKNRSQAPSFFAQPGTLAGWLVIFNKIYMIPGESEFRRLLT